VRGHVWRPEDARTPCAGGKFLVERGCPARLTRGAPVSALALDISISPDGYATGANASDGAPMGIGVERPHVRSAGLTPFLRPTRLSGPPGSGAGRDSASSGRGSSASGSTPCSPRRTRRPGRPTWSTATTHPRLVQPGSDRGLRQRHRPVRVLARAARRHVPHRRPLAGAEAGRADLRLGACDPRPDSAAIHADPR
jgi:hypothetical protein